MANLNAVAVELADLYTGEDQPVTYTPDAGLDVSGIPKASWSVELRLFQGRVELAAASPASFLTVAMSWDSVNSLFQCVIARAQTLTLAPGRWTMDVWRTNPGAARLLVRAVTTVYPAVQP